MGAVDAGMPAVTGHAIGGVGVDLCPIAAVAAALAAHPRRYPDAVLSLREQQSPQAPGSDPTRLALAFAVKEAVTKALCPAPAAPWRLPWIEVDLLEGIPHRTSRRLGEGGSDPVRHVAVRLHDGAAALAVQRGVTHVTATAGLMPSASGESYPSMAVATAIAHQGEDMSETDTDRATLEAEVRDAVGRHARLGVPVADLDPRASLSEAGLTSHATVHLMLDLEDTLDVEFPEELITKDTFATLDNLVAALMHARESA